MNKKNKGILAVLLLFGLLLSGGLTGCGGAGQKSENLEKDGLNQEENSRTEKEDVREADTEQGMELPLAGKSCLSAETAFLHLPDISLTITANIIRKWERLPM